MENIVTTFKVFKKKVLSSGKSMRRNPAFAWKFLLSFCAVGVIAAAVGGYFIYLNVSSVKDTEVAVGGARSILRPGDVLSVLKVYQEKKERLNALIADEPTFLTPGKGISLSIPTEPLASSSVEFIP